MNCEQADVEFHSGPALCRGWLYRPRAYNKEQRPCIVMAHGLGGTRDAGLEAYAEKFAAAGYVVLLFDYRHFGASDGEPRQLFSVGCQLQDWESAIGYARRLDGVDPKRVALWGTSFSGGHVIVAAAKDGDIAAISAQCPMMDALAGAISVIKHAGIATFMKLGLYGMVDQIRAMLRMSPLYVPVVASPGEAAALASPDAVSGYAAIAPSDWRNEITPRYALTIARYRPITFAERVSCPVLIQVCMKDSMAPPSLAIETAEKIGGKAKLIRYECEHFDIYVGKYFERASNEQLAFFNLVLTPIKGEAG